MQIDRTRSEGPAIGLLIALTAINSLALNTFVPAMPLAAQEFGASTDTLQLTLTLYLIGVGIAQLFYGPLSDRFGRRPLLLGGTAFFMLASLACAFADSPLLLIIERLFQALGGCAGIVLGRAIVRDVWDADRAVPVLAKIMTVMAVVPALSPALGGWIGSEFGWRAIFIMVAVASGFVLVWCALTLPETNRQRLALPRMWNMLTGYRTVIGDPVFRGLTFSTSLISSCWFAYLSAAPFIMQFILNRPAYEFGLVCCIMAVTYTIGTYVSGRLAGRVARIKVMGAGLVAACIGAAVAFGLSLAGQVDVITMIAPMAFLTFGHGLNSPGSIALAIGVRPELRGTGSGLFGAIQMGFSALATLVTGVLGHDALHLNGLLAGITVLALLAFLPGARAYRAGRLKPPN